MLSKRRRLQLFFERLSGAPPADSADEALASLATILNEVEDKHSGTEYNPDAWAWSDVSPREDNRRNVPDRPSLRRYRSAKHNTFIGLNGSIRIEDLSGNVLLDKPGRDGRKTDDLDM